MRNAIMLNLQQGRSLRAIELVGVAIQVAAFEQDRITHLQQALAQQHSRAFRRWPSADHDPIKLFARRWRAQIARIGAGLSRPHTCTWRGSSKYFCSKCTQQPFVEHIAGHDNLQAGRPSNTAEGCLVRVQFLGPVAANLCRWTLHACAEGDNPPE